MNRWIDTRILGLFCLTVAPLQAQDTNLGIPDLSTPAAVARVQQETLTWLRALSALTNAPNSAQFLVATNDALGFQVLDGRAVRYGLDARVFNGEISASERQRILADIQAKRDVALQRVEVAIERISANYGDGGSGTLPPLPDGSSAVAQGTSYRHIPNAYIQGHNLRALNNASVEDCIRACDQDNKCLSVDYDKKSRRCDLGSRNSTREKLNRSSTRYDFYEKPVGSQGSDNTSFPVKWTMATANTPRELRYPFDVGPSVHSMRVRIQGGVDDSGDGKVEVLLFAAGAPPEPLLSVSSRSSDSEWDEWQVNSPGPGRYTLVLRERDSSSSGRFPGNGGIANVILESDATPQGTHYQHVPNAAISGHNTRQLTGVSVKACIAACDREPWCKSFDYYKGQDRCDLSNKSAAEAGGLKTDFAGNPYDHYQKPVEPQGTRYQHVPNAAISGHNTRQLTGVSVKACIAACDREPWCKSFDYYKGQDRCDLSNKSAAEAGGLKTDFAGNPYDHYQKPVEPQGTHYQHVPNAAISGHNTRQLTGVSVKACIAACDREPWCKSFDYYKGQDRCDLSNKSAAEAGGLKTDFAGNPYDHYQKPVEPQGTHYQHVPNAAISGHNTRQLTGVSVKACIAACDREPWCKSFDYYKGQDRCDLSNKSAAEAGGLKTDFAGNPYDHYQKPVEPQGTHYQHVPNAAISGHNTRQLTGVSVKACIAACDREPWCKSFDYYKGQDRCDLSNKSAAEAGGLKTDFAGNPYDHYQKPVEPQGASGR